MAISRSLLCSNTSCLWWSGRRRRCPLQARCGIVLYRKKPLLCSSRITVCVFSKLTFLSDGRQINLQVLQWHRSGLYRYSNASTRADQTSLSQRSYPIQDTSCHVVWSDHCKYLPLWLHLCWSRKWTYVVSRIKILVLQDFNIVFIRKSLLGSSADSKSHPSCST